jgi:hypothetical protein
VFRVVFSVRIPYGRETTVAAVPEKSHSRVKIDQAGVRKSLDPDREPYWATPIKAGQFIGFRKIDDKRGSWIARARDPERNQRYRYNVLCDGPFTIAATDAPTYDAAMEVAKAWFAELDAGVITNGPFTVADACKEYVAELRSEKRTAAADDAEWRFKRGAIYGHEDDGEDTELTRLRLGRIEVKRLRPPTIKKWRELLDMKNSGANRMMTTLRAALNLAVENDKVTATAARAWRSVKQHEKADGRREIFLDLRQRRALLDACKGSLHQLLEAALLTGARPGELVGALRGAFDARTKTLKLCGKTGTRTLPLPPAAVSLFERLSESKLPTAPLLTQDDGTPWTKMAWSRAIRAAAATATYKDDKNKTAELPAGIVLYTMRHTYISQAILDGLTTLDVARLTGTSLAMIDKHYGHLVQGSVHERIAKVGML